jgi:crotonobetainyl-CoA:carnitine CoA-transferase CaiB-like acyl-CoA transferase
MDTYPLRGIRVVDLTSNIAAPFSGAILADLGASVTHVEAIAGDDSRRMAPRVGDVSAYWQVVNRNKDVVRLDIRESEGQKRLHEMLAEADVFITNLRPEKLSRNGLDYQSLRKLYPRLIHAALSAYGAKGSESNRAGYDAVLQARTGIAEITGTSDGPPVRTGVSVLDIGAGTWLALAIITALYERKTTNEGGSVATSLFETGANWVAYHVAANQVTKQSSGRYGSGHPAFSPYGIFDTNTVPICIGIGGDSIFKNFCSAIGLDELPEDSRFSTNPSRVANDAELREIIEKHLADLDGEGVVELLDRVGVPCDVVQKPEGLLNDSQANANEVFMTVDMEGFGPIRIPSLPITFDGERPMYPNSNPGSR